MQVGLGLVVLFWPALLVQLVPPEDGVVVVGLVELLLLLLEFLLADATGDLWGFGAVY